MPRHLQSQSYSTGPAAIASSCFTARCDSIWYGFFIATLLFSAKENSLSAYQGWERGVATFYDLPGIPRYNQELLTAPDFFSASVTARLDTRFMPVSSHQRRSL